MQGSHNQVGADTGANKVRWRNWAHRLHMVLFRGARCPLMFPSEYIKGMKEMNPGFLHTTTFMFLWICVFIQCLAWPTVASLREEDMTDNWLITCVLYSAWRKKMLVKQRWWQNELIITNMKFLFIMKLPFHENRHWYNMLVSFAFI